MLNSYFSLNKLDPFGEPACESELQLLGVSEYRQYYFSHLRFSHESMQPKVFMIVGRRGSGKTALAQFFSFQQLLPNATAIDVDEPAAFQQVMTKLAANAGYSREVAVPRIAKIWEFVMWSIIFRQFQHQDPRIKAACLFNDDTAKVSTFIRHLLRSLAEKYLKTEDELADELEHLISGKTFEKAKETVLAIAKRHPIIIAFDTLENYSLTDDSMMRVMAALIQCASNFSRTYASQNIYIKLFIMDEIFPYLKEEAILNPLKFIHDEIYLYWNPKDLMKLICWRFWHYLRARGMMHQSYQEVAWDDHHDVLKKVWEPYFGKQIVNGDGLPEKTFPYVLRHTQMRPRQLIVLCNSIAKCAKEDKSFPHFIPDNLVQGIKQGEENLADEVFNSYASVYPNAAKIADALSGLPLIFKGQELDKRARETASQWPAGEYSPYAFRQLVAELGIVGRVRQKSETAGIVEADFEYAQPGRLPLLTEDLCVIHPMFFKKLNVKISAKLRVYPFPDHRDFKELNYHES
jgi:hypothetical protein